MAKASFFKSCISVPYVRKIRAFKFSISSGVIFTDSDTFSISIQCSAWHCSFETSGANDKKDDLIRIDPKQPAYFSYLLYDASSFFIHNKESATPSAGVSSFPKVPQLTDQQIHQILAVHGISTLTHITYTQSHTKSRTTSCVSHSHKRHLLPRLSPQI